MAIPVALRRRLGPCNVPRSVKGSLYKSDHSQRGRRIYSLPAVSMLKEVLIFDIGLLLRFKVPEPDPRGTK
jgi:hypothetical protein